MTIKKKVTPTAPTTTTKDLKDVVKKVVKKEKAVKGVPDVAEVVKPAEGINTGEVTLTAVPQRRIGMSKGMTINMGDYQSARIDVWMERVVPDNDREVEKAYAEISKTLDEHLTDEVNELKG